MFFVHRRLVFAVSLLLMLTVPSQETRAINANPTPPKSKEPDCESFLSSTAMAKLTTEMTKYFSEKNGKVKAPEELTDLEVLQVVDGAFVVKQAGGLKLVRQTSIGKDDFQTVDIDGNEIKDIKRVGGYYIVTSKGTAEKGQVRPLFVNVIDPSFSNKVFPAGPRPKILEVEIPKSQGLVLTVNQELIVIAKTSFSGFTIVPGSQGYSMMSTTLNGPVSSINFEQINGQDFPIVKVIYQGFKKNNSTNEKRIALFNYKLSGPFIRGVESKVEHALNPIIDYSAKVEPKFYSLPYNKNSLLMVDSSDRETRFTRFFFSESNRTVVDTLITERPLDPNSLSLVVNKSRAVIFEIKGVGQKDDELSDFLILEGRSNLDIRRFGDDSLDNDSEGEYWILPKLVLNGRVISTLEGEGLFTLSETVPGLTAKIGKRYTAKAAFSGKEHLTHFIHLKNIDANSGSNNFSVESSLPITKVEPAKDLGSSSLEVLKIQVANLDEPEDPWIYLDRRHGKMLITPQPKSVHHLKIGMQNISLFFSQSGKGSFKKQFFTIYDYTDRDFTASQSFHGSSLKFPTHSDISLSRVANSEQLLAPEELPFKTDFTKAKLTKLDEIGTYSIELPIIEGDFKKALVIFNPQSLSKPIVIYDPYEVDIVGNLGYKTLAGTAIAQLSEPLPELSRAELNHTDFLVVPEKNKRDKKWHTIIFPGKIHKIEKVAGNKVRGYGAQNLVTADVPVEFLWHVGNREYEYMLVNMLDEPAYEDKEIEVMVTRGYRSEKPAVVLHDKNSDSFKEIKLSFSFDEKTKSKGVAGFTASMFGIDEIKSGENQSTVNKNDIEEVWREDDLLFFKTNAESNAISNTYIYSLKKKQLMFMIPNYAKHIDIGGYRFYFGNPSYFSKSIVAVFDQKSHRFITHFDFGKTKLAIDDPDLVKRDAKSRRMFFRTESGVLRVFDEKLHSFLGLLPEKIKKLIDPLKSEMGQVLNDKIFRMAHEKLLNREGVMGSLQTSFPLTTRNKTANRLMLLGDSGAGKTQAVSELISRYMSGNLKPRSDVKVVFFKIDPSEVSSNTMYRGQYATKFTKLKEAAEKLQNEGYRLVVILDNVDQIDGFKDKNFGEGDIFSHIAGMMEDDSFDILATATPQGYQFLKRSQASFTGHFSRTVKIEEMSTQDTVKSLMSYMKTTFPNLKVEEEAIRSVVSRLDSLSIERALPGSAFDLIKAIISEKVAAQEDTKSKSKKKVIKLTKDDLNHMMAQKTGVPSILFDLDNLGTRYREMETYLKARVQGQDHAVDELLPSVFAFAQEVNRNDLPILKILMAGSTGVGKTELAKALSHHLFSSDKALLKISGEDYGQGVSGQTIHDLKQSIINHIRKYPFNIILFDEFEKMGIAAQNLLLSLADGKLTDDKGKPVSTTMTILLGTSNAGVREMVRAVESQNFGFSNDESEALGRDEAYKIVMDALEKDVAPELVNRFDQVVIFNSLAIDVARNIVQSYLTSEEDLATNSVRARYLQKGIDLSFDPAVIDKIVAESFNIKMGARRLVVNTETIFVKKFLSQAFLFGKLKAGNSYKIAVDPSTNEYLIEEK